MKKPTAHISVDLDTVDTLLAGYGIQRPPCDLIYRLSVPRLLDLLDRLQLKATLFVIARDAEAEADLLRDAARRGHEIASHSLTHALPFSTLPADRMHHELCTSRSQLEKVVGRPVIGFRAPGCDVDQRTLGAVARAGYGYDASVMPSPALFAGVMLRLLIARGAVRDLPLWSGLRSAFSRRRPYRTSPNGSLWEFPVAVSAVLRVPFIHTLWYLAPAALCRRTYRALCRSGVCLSYQLHAADLLGLEEDNIDPRMTRHPGMDVPLRRKLALLEEILSDIAATYDVMTYADALGQANGANSHSEAA